MAAFAFHVQCMPLGQRRPCIASRHVAPLQGTRIISRASAAQFRFLRRWQPFNVGHLNNGKQNARQPGLRRRSAQRTVLDLPQRATWCRAPRPRSRSSTRASCWATASGKGMRLHKGALLFLEAHLDRLFEGARAIELDIGLDRDGHDGGAPANARRQRHGARRAHPPDGHARREEGAQPGPAQLRWASPPSSSSAEYKEPSPEIVSARAVARHLQHPLHAGRDVRHAAQLAQPAESRSARCSDVHRSRRRRGADARSARLRLQLQRHELLLCAGRRGADLDRRVLLQRRDARQCDRALPRERHSRSGSAISRWTTCTRRTRRS